jgi:hypothetical protein
MRKAHEKRESLKFSKKDKLRWGAGGSAVSPESSLRHPRNRVPAASKATTTSPSAMPKTRQEI